MYFNVCISTFVFLRVLSTHRIHKNNKTECKFYEQLECVLGGPSRGPKVTYDPDELMEEEGEGDEEEEEELKQEEEEEEEDTQFLGCTSREVIGGTLTVTFFLLFFC